MWPPNIAGGLNTKDTTLSRKTDDLLQGKLARQWHSLPLAFREPEPVCPMEKRGLSVLVRFERLGPSMFLSQARLVAILSLSCFAKNIDKLSKHEFFVNWVRTL